MIKNPFRMPDLAKRADAESFALPLIIWTFGIAFLTWMLWGMFQSIAAIAILIAAIAILITCVLGIVSGMYYTYTFLTYRYLVWKEKKHVQK